MLPAASLIPSPALSGLPTPTPAPSALAVLHAAQSAPEASPAALYASGRKTFDFQSVMPAAASVLASHGTPPALPAPSASVFHAAVSVPAALPLASADGSGTLLLAAGGALLVVLVARALIGAAKPVRPLPRPPMPEASYELADLQAQTTALVEALYASCAHIRDPRKAARALDAAWGEMAASGGIARWNPYPGEWTMTPIHRALFDAIDLPQIIGLIDRRGGERYADMLSDTLRGLSVEPERASSTEDLFSRLRWWKEHFRQFDLRR